MAVLGHILQAGRASFSSNGKAAFGRWELEESWLSLDFRLTLDSYPLLLLLPTSERYGGEEDMSNVLLMIHCLNRIMIHYFEPDNVPLF